MTKNEFDRWMADFETRFPQKAKSLAEAGQATIDSWQEVLAKCKLADAIEANMELQAGEVKMPFHWDEIPARVRSLCRQWSARAAESQNNQSWKETAKPNTTTPKGGFRAALRALFDDPRRPGETKAERYERQESIVEKYLDIVD